MKRPPCINPPETSPRIALALGGGAARGWAHIGVLRALDELGIRPDIIVGTSIGAVVGGCYVADHLDALEAFARGMSLSRILGCLDLSFSGAGLMSGRKIRLELNKYLKDVKIEEIKRRFTAVATELGTGQEVWLSEGGLVEAMHASFAIPGVFQPVEIGGRWFMDGACVNPVPVSACRALGADIVIAVTVNGSRANSAGEIAEVGLSSADDGVRAPAMPGMFNVMMEAFNATLETITQTRLAHEQPDVILSPSVGEIGMFDFHRAEEAILAGYNTAKDKLTDGPLHSPVNEVASIAA